MVWQASYDKWKAPLDQTKPYMYTKLYSVLLGLLW